MSDLAGVTRDTFRGLFEGSRMKYLIDMRAPITLRSDDLLDRLMSIKYFALGRLDRSCPRHQISLYIPICREEERGIRIFFFNPVFSYK